MRILIVGLPKSGTTILTYRVAAALDDAAIEFEPPAGPDPELAAGREHVVTKKLVGSQTADLDAFSAYDRTIWICRDPRDFLVSQTLYRWHREQAPEPIDQVWFDRVIERLVAKEAAPSEVPFLDLEPADYSATFDAVADLWERQRAVGDWFLYRYEDMVAGRYDELDRYLGFGVDPEASVDVGLSRVARRKGSGDWRHWFTQPDVDHYRAAGLDRYMATFGYDDDDWELESEPRIEPEHGSAYVSALFHDHERSDAADRSDRRPSRRFIDRLIGQLPRPARP